MSWTGSSPLTAMREGMWGLMLFAAASWLAIGWSVLRLEPSNVVVAAGAVVLFGALTEVLRACAGTRTWWLNAGMAALFGATAMLLMTAPETSYTTPAALIGWYLMVRGTMDIAVAGMARDSARVWGLLMMVGVVEAGLGFFAASPLSRTADLVVTIVGGLGLLRAVADLVTALRIREVRAARSRVLEVPPERAAGLAGYTAGLTDYESAPARRRPRHRAATAASLGSSALPNRAVRSDREALARVRSGPERWPRSGTGAGSEPVPRIGSGTADGSVAVSGPGRPADTFHDEVVRTTADLDAMLALAGVTGAGVGAHLDEHPHGYVVPEVPDTPEGVDQTERAAQDAGVGVDDTSIIAGVRRSD